jgi:hypothetical protein
MTNPSYTMSLGFVVATEPSEYASFEFADWANAGEATANTANAAAMTIVFILQVSCAASPAAPDRYAAAQAAANILSVKF